MSIKGVQSRKELYPSRSAMAVALLCTAQLALPQETKDTTEQARTASQQELVLQQLTELRKELIALRREMAGLRGKVEDIHKVAVRPTPTAQPVAEVSLDDDPALGSSEATVAIVEFSDLQCPYCERFHEQTFPKLKETYIDSGKVLFVFRDFPLKQIHPQAKAAAVAANCAGDQDRFWEMHHELFVNRPRLGPELYEELANGFELDLDAFRSCLAEPGRDEEVEKDLAYGQSLGIRGTPHYFIGKIEDGKIVSPERVSGAQPFQNFQRIIENALK